MELIDSVLKICRDLPDGWKQLLKDLGLDLNDDVLSSASNLTTALHRRIRVRRSMRGFEDFALSSARAIESGKPAESLLYHALASPKVLVDAQGLPELSASDYPSIADLDLLENYCFSLNRDNLILDGAFVAVMAYQYRPGTRSSHGQHADMAYSRTGVARVGIAKGNYQGFRRSFWILPKDGSDGISVMPARYAAFLAVRSSALGVGSVMGGHEGLTDNDYIFPIHKLFEGQECLPGREIHLQMEEYHRNDKIRKIHADELQGEGGISLPEGFDKGVFPFVRDSDSPEKLVNLERIGSSWLVVPIERPTLVRTASQFNESVGREQIVHFDVPRQTVIRGRPTRFETSLEIPAFGSVRRAPEYVNIRHRVDPDGPVDQQPEDINNLPKTEFDLLIRNGKYAAAHFVDDSCDGWLMAKVSGFASTQNDQPAYSLVTAPDFFPLADQADLIDLAGSIGRIEPMSSGRIPANLELAFRDGRLAFGDRNETVSAVVSPLPQNNQRQARDGFNILTSFLPDAASDVYAPGWDVSLAGDDQGLFKSASGLGSPFPEDAKLCAALSSFWPAVAPDAARTFGDAFPSQIPMLDAEVGYHSNHPRVQDGTVQSSRGWDGEQGPFFEVADAQEVVNFVAIERSDYVANALKGQISAKLTAQIQSIDLALRFNALVRCFRLLNSRPSILVTAEKVEQWRDHPDRGSGQLSGDGYYYIFADLGLEIQNGNDLKRILKRVSRKFECQISSRGIALKMDNGAFRFFENA